MTQRVARATRARTARPSAAARAQVLLGVRRRARSRTAATGVFSRVAVSTSCRGLRERTCISTSPAATIGRPRELRDALHHVGERRRRRRGAAARARGAARSPNQVFSPHRLREHLFERLRRRGHEQREAVGQAGEHRRVGHLALDVARVREVSPFGARRRATVIQCDRLP